MAKYEPSGKVGLPGLLMVLAAGLASGALAAGAFHFVGRFFYAVVLFPLLWGALVGWATAVAVKKGKCRSVLAGAAAGLTGAVLSYGLYHMLENLYLREKVREAMAARFPNREEFERAYNENLMKSYGGTGFMAELARRAEMGISIRRRSSSTNDKAPTFTGKGVYVYWLVELAIIAAIGLALPAVATRQPFCERCGKWYVRKDVAGIDPSKLEDARRVLSARSLGALPGLLRADPSDGVLSLEKCPKACGAPARVQLVLISRDRRGKKMGRKTAYQDMFELKDAEAIEKAVPKPGVPPPTGPAAGTPALG